MRVGMTGTRDGMTGYQKEMFTSFLMRDDVTELHHGDCLGADKDAHDIAVKVGGIKIVIHPPEKSDLRAYCVGDEYRKEKNYFARNRDIVNESDVLLGTPKSVSNKRGGTWYTINYSKGKDKPTGIIHPTDYVKWSGDVV